MATQNKNSKMGTKSDLLIVFATIGIISVLFIPLPPMALDFLSICNVSAALLILLLTFYSEKPLSFSTFPSILLITTLFRLALNISATRLILDEASAGKVIGAIGEYVIGGNYVVGVVVFIILIVVQYVVVTSGAQRVAEVAARFTLDSMPGKQMSIDADLNIGVISEDEARKKREEIQQEANFYGAMDGATKFVKGDAIAGIIIIFVDIVAGLMMGVGHHRMSWNEALHTYALLTVGDGIVTQIPSLIIATATGIIITRAATDSKLGSEVVEQVTAHPVTLVILAACIGLLLFLPGLPKGALALAFLAVLAMFVYSYRRARVLRDESSASDDTDDEFITANDKEDIYDHLELHPIEVRIGADSQELIEQCKSDLNARMQNIRKQFALDSGFVVPSIKVVGSYTGLQPEEYEVYIYGVKLGTGQIKHGYHLAIAGAQTKVQIDGEKTIEPTYGLPAVWISDAQVQMAKAANYTIVDWQTMLITHIGEIVRTNSDSLLTRSEVGKLLERNKENCEGLIEELIPNVMSLTDIQKVLQSLLRENVPIRNIALILEVLADVGKRLKSTDEVVEEVRLKLGATICQQLLSKNGRLEVLTLEPDLERLLISSVNPPERMSAFSIDPSGKEQLLKSLSVNAGKMMSRNHMPVVMCSPVIRRRLKQLTERALPRLAIIAMTEVPPSITVSSFDVVKASVGESKLGASYG